MYFYNHFSAYSKINAGNDRKIQKYSDVLKGSNYFFIQVLRHPDTFLYVTVY